MVNKSFLPWDGCIKTVPEGMEESWEWYGEDEGAGAWSIMLVLVSPGSHQPPQAVGASCPRCSKQDFFLSTAIDAIKLCSLCGEE